MIIPIGHDRQSVRRIPFITFGIIILCFTIHIWIVDQSKTQAIEMQKKVMEYLTFYQTHPYLEFGKKIRERFNLGDDQRIKTISNIFQKSQNIKTPDENTIQLEQEEFDLLEEDFLTAIEEMPHRKYGFIPIRRNFVNSITYQFLHGGWLHLIFNLYLFFILGYCIEDAWGKIIFTGFYLMGGIFAAYMYAVHFPDFVGPLIGASGAIAAIMGAFIVRFWDIKIKFVYIFYFIFNGTFKLSAWVFLLIWILIQFVNVGIQETMMKGYGMRGAGVAYWAHIWGFAFGVAFALLMKFLKIEEKVINPAFDKKDKYIDERYIHFDRAMDLKSQGKTAEAFDTLVTAVKIDPLNYEAGEGMWELGVLLKRQHHAKEYFLKMIEAEIKTKKFDRALFHLQDLKSKFPDTTLSNNSKISLMEYFFNGNMAADADLIADQIAGEFTEKTPPGLVVQFFEILIKFDKSKARDHLSVLKIFNSINPDTKEKLIARINDPNNLEKNSQGKNINKLTNRGKFIERDTLKVETGPTDFDDFLPQPIEKTLEVKNGIPLYFKDNYLAISVQDKKKALLFQKIRMLSVVRIVPENAQSYLIVDFFLDLPTANKSQINVIRLLSKNFYPKKIFPLAKNTLDAFKKFLEILLKLSRAKPYPDKESVKLIKLKKFSSIEEYEKYVLNK